MSNTIPPPREASHATAVSLGGQPRGYKDRLAAELCVQPGCGDPPADDSNRCPRHRDAKRESDARTAAARRHERRRGRRKACAECGWLPKEGSSPYRCPRCKASAGQVSVGDRVGIGVGIEGQIRKDPTGRTRYHGQMRPGRQTKVTTAMQSITVAEREIVKAREGLIYAASPEVAAYGRIMQGDTTRAALSQLAHAIRHLEEVLELYDYEQELRRAAPRPK